MRWGRRLGGCAGWLALAPLWILAAAHGLLDDHHFVLALLHVGIGYLIVPVAALWAFAWALGRRWLARAALLLVALCATWTFPGTLRARTAPAQADLRVGTANLLMVNPSPDALLDELVALDADVWLLQEVDPAWAARLGAPRITAAYPHRHVDASEGSFGVAVLSKLPLETASSWDLDGVPAGAATVRVGGELVIVVGVHTLPPNSVGQTPWWHAQMRQLEAWATHLPGRWVLAGDLNATRHHPSYQRLITAGLRDAHAERGRAAVSSWPNGLFPALPIRLDHVLVSPGLAVVDVEEGRGPGSDHRPLVADVALVDLPAVPRRPPPVRRMTGSAGW